MRCKSGKLVGVPMSLLSSRAQRRRKAHVRRAQLYYMRDLTGKAARLREKRLN